MYLCYNTAIPKKKNETEEKTMSDEVKLNDQSLGDVAGGGAAGPTWYDQGKLMYRVVFGDTLSEIAWKYGTTVQAIMNLNPNLITNPDFIREGWVIRIR